ncbi:MAG: hypothetical protein R3F43_05860 [bacterium]
MSSPELQAHMDRFPYEIVEADNGDAWVHLRGRTTAPPRSPRSSSRR